MPQHPFTLNHGGHLFKGKRVVLDGQRDLDGTDAVLPAQARSLVRFGQHGVAADDLANLGDQIHYRWSDGVGWLIFHLVSLSHHVFG